MGTRRLIIEILGDARGAQQAFGDADTSAQGFGSRLASLGPIAAAGAAAVVTGVAAAGAALYSIGSEFDSAFDHIRVTTGQTGEALESLEESFRAVAANAPSSFEDISTALAAVNQRLGTTGVPLERLTGQFLTLSRITETDLATNIETVTRLFGDWGITADDQAERLDQLFRASQASGVGVDVLSSSIVQFGAPMRNLGFQLDESIALFAQFERNGVNAETVMAGLRGSVGRLARAGEDVPATFRRIMGEIEALGPGTEATAMAMELFGARAGPDLADAIANGQFAIGDLMDTIANGTDTINQAGLDTEDFGEKFQRIKNRVFLALEPIAVKVFDAVGQAMDRLGPMVDKFATWFGEVMPIAIAWLQAKIEEWRPKVMAAFAQITAWVEENWPQMRDTIVDVMTTVGEVISGVIDAVTIIWENFGTQITAFVSATFTMVVGIIEGAMTAIRGVVDIVLGLLSGDWSRVWDGIKAVFEGVWNVMISFATGTVARMAAIFSGVWETIRSVAASAWQGIVGFVTGEIDRIVGFVTGVHNRIAGVATGMFDGIKDAFRSAINWLIGAWNRLDFGIHVSIPNWVPGVGGRGFDVDDIFPDIPLLAGGAVISSPTLAWIGEDQRSTPEIVTPEDLMRTVVREEAGGAVTLVNRGVIGSQAELERWLAGALEKLARKGLVSTRGSRT